MKLLYLPRSSFLAVVKYLGTFVESSTESSDFLLLFPLLNLSTLFPEAIGLNETFFSGFKEKLELLGVRVLNLVDLIEGDDGVVVKLVVLVLKVFLRCRVWNTFGSS